jgi:hypothetical protein
MLDMSDKKFIAALGFAKTTTTFHSQKFKGQEFAYYTIVGHRTSPIGEPKG